MTVETVGARAVAVLVASDPAEKVRLSHEAAADWRAGRLSPEPGPRPPDRPGRPSRPELRPPREMPKRKAGGSLAGRVALLHALAHIELNAIDLAWDILARFGAEVGDSAFIDDWVTVADEEALHFDLLDRRLGALGATYGDLPAHDGLWEASDLTADDLLARLAIVPMVLEARGLDVTPAMIDNLTRAQDPESAAILQRIHDDEIGHVARGRAWFETVCQDRNLEPVPTWQALVRARFRGVLKPPFNDASRAAAGFGSAFYRPLAEAGAEPSQGRCNRLDTEPSRKTHDPVAQ